MAIGKTVQIKTIVNNDPLVRVITNVEPIVVNGALVADKKDSNPGVNSKDRQ